MKILILLLTLALCLASGCTETATTPTNTTRTNRSIHTEMGLPVDGDSSDDFLIKRDQYELSYSSVLNAANWVSWQEDASWYDTVARCDCFTTDPLLPSWFTKIVTGDYTGSGYDRAHLLGSECRTRTALDNKATFYMTNIIPQHPELNQETWASMERFCDSLSTKANKQLFIVAGGLYLTKNRVNGKIAIPDSCWKIVVVLERGQLMKDVSKATPVYAVMMNNGPYDNDKNDWWRYKTTVRAIEQSTGYKLLSDVPQSIQDVIETKVW